MVVNSCSSLLLCACFCSSDGQSVSKVHFESSGLGINDLMIVLFVLMYCTAPVAHCVIGKMGVKCDLKA